MKKIFVKLAMAIAYVMMMVAIFLVQKEEERYRHAITKIVSKFGMSVEQVMMLIIAFLILFSFLVLIIQGSIYKTILKLLSQSEEAISKVFPSIVFSVLFMGIIFIVCKFILKSDLGSTSVVFQMISLGGLTGLFYLQTKEKKATTIVGSISMVFLGLDILFQKIAN